jgi:hypothetical protein
MYTIMDIGTECDTLRCQKPYNFLKNEGSSRHWTLEQLCLSYSMLSYQQIQLPGGTDIKQAFTIAHLS